MTLIHIVNGNYFDNEAEALAEQKALRDMGVPDDENTIETREIIPFPREADYRYVPGVAREWHTVERYIRDSAMRTGFRVFTHDHEDGTYSYAVFATDAEVEQMFNADTRP